MTGRQKLNSLFKGLCELKFGERIGNPNGTVTHCGDHMRIETEKGAKKTDCVNAAQFLCGLKKWEDLAEFEETEN